MTCNICEGHDFTRCQYRARGVEAPAFECACCHALILDEEAATSSSERSSVRLAIALRSSVSQRYAQTG